MSTTNESCNILPDINKMSISNENTVEYKYKTPPQSPKRLVVPNAPNRIVGHKNKK